MSASTLFIVFLIPLVAGVLELLVLRSGLWLKNLILLLATGINLWLCVQLYGHNAYFQAPLGAYFQAPPGGFGFQFALRLYHFNSVLLIAAGFFGFMVAIFSSVFMKKHWASGQFFAYLLFTLGMTNGVLLANDLIVLLFFWEGLLLTLFGMIVIGHKDAYRTAIKAFIIAGVTDLCMLMGIALTGHIANTTLMTQIHLQTGGLASVAFVLMAIGAVSKGGCMPFHSWIPDAAIDAPLPFMALLPGALEKVLGIYLLSRITLDLFSLTPGSNLSVLLMALGAVTIVLAVLMALIQRDYKRLLSFHAISQLGYMVLGIGTALPVGIVGGIFHMINNALYKSCLFLTGGAVENQTGTTDLAELGGLRRVMPYTCAGFLIAAASISGVPPFNGFFSKELLYDAALERGFIFYLAAIIGSFLTAASFLKLGHAAYFGPMKDKYREIREAPLPLLVPVLLIAAICIIFGLWNSFPVETLIAPVLGDALKGHHIAGMPGNILLVTVTVVVLILAAANHMIGVKRSGSGLGAVDHIHYAPGLHSVYSRAEKRYFDPYEIGMKIVRGISVVAFGLDRFNDWIYNSVIPFITFSGARALKAAHTGSHVHYMLWSLAGLVLIVIAFIFG